MVDPFLGLKIQEAQRAADALAEQRQLEQRAAELQPLLEEQARQEQVGQAIVALEQTLDLLAARLETLKQATGSFQERFAALRAEATALAIEYARLSQAQSAIRAELNRAYNNFQQAVSQHVWVGQHPTWVTSQNNEAERLGARLKEISLFPTGASPYASDVNFDPLAAAVAGQVRPALSLRRQIGIR